MKGVPLLPEAVVADFEEDYEGQWWRLKWRVEGINRTDESWDVATAMVHVVVTDRSVRKIGVESFHWCSNLVKVTAHPSLKRWDRKLLMGRSTSVMRASALM